MPVNKDSPAPYAPASAVLELVRRHRARGLPSPVDSEVLGRAGISDSLIPRTLQALFALDLIDGEGIPTKTFEGIRLAPETEYRSRLEEWLKAAYADVFAFVDPAKDDSIRIRDAFRGYQPTGQQDRMVSLFQGLCVEAGLMTERKDASAKKDKQSKSSLRIKPSKLMSVNTPSSQPASNSTSTKEVDHLPPALAGLLATLPRADEGWTKVQRDKFVATFTAVLDYSIPTVANQPDE